MSWNGPCIQRNCFNKNSFQRNCFSKNFFQRNSFSRNCSTKSPMSEKSICSMCRNQQPISPNIVPRNRFQGLFFHMSLIHISKPSISKIPIPKHPFDGSKGLRSVVPSFRSVIPSFPHFAIVYIPTIQKLSPFQQTVFSQTWFRQITQSAIHQNQQSIKISIPSKNQHSIIPEKVLEVRHYVRIQRYRVIQYVTVTSHHVTAINHIYTAINHI